MVYTIGNLHGCIDEWKEMLGKISFNNFDEIYVLGDVIDKGPEPIKLLFNMMLRSNVFVVLGNHEYAFLKCMKNVPFDATLEDFTQHLSEENMNIFSEWIKSGGRVTFEQFMELSADDREAILDYLEEFSPYDIINIDNKEFVLTHSGLKNFEPDKAFENYSIHDFIFNKPQHGQKFFENKTLICSASPTLKSDGSFSGRIHKEANFININCGCIYSDNGGRLGCLRLDDMKEFYI
ncbi:MAG TPA: metallophosphoesterase [Clostridia bacterium]|nr:metallophosphoesterase [Clostridia bacterium]